MRRPAALALAALLALTLAACGAQPTDTVRVLLKKTGVIEK